MGRQLACCHSHFTVLEVHAVAGLVCLVWRVWRNIEKAEHECADIPTYMNTKSEAILEDGNWKVFSEYVGKKSQMR